MIIAYTDGSTYKTNPGPMSWAVVYVKDGEIISEKMGALYTGTNNKAELLGVVWALEHDKQNDLLIRTDSILTLNIATGIWRAKTNLNEWERYTSAIKIREKRGLITNFEHVKGHGPDIFNKKADSLARLAAAEAARCLKEQEVK